ncbi:unnamed protein product [Heligmosomoides polygyrus]|uniref:Transposase_31 domain-containing protein n=1 Tax=Heligmosomoides polygyrus TaxID=6339 RepID=A0A183FQW6_HELPZ|nr:unnamed protein product [Heligmosomoides polygyrus]
MISDDAWQFLPEDLIFSHLHFEPRRQEAHIDFSLSDFLKLRLSDDSFILYFDMLQVLIMQLYISDRLITPPSGEHPELDESDLTVFLFIRRYQWVHKSLKVGGQSVA